MKQFDLVQLKNAENYKFYNISNGMHGIIFSLQGDQCEVIFFNPQNVGECILAKINPQDLKVKSEKLPREMMDDLYSNMDSIRKKAKEKFEPLKIKPYDLVELLVEDANYAKFGIHKGDVGCVMDANAILGYIEVDFSEVYKNGEYFGECISVKIDDLKVV